eukprot:TRINITY_DN87166_c0_g1_i1.p1 TRINITY_DN87166_c0_g1~~TRINITY_DN87166_c0_g1_i1.p1  ORF type:complete len:150 (+),score=34.18 TRINITY_DN87166_c0_g1_i1:28-477(+)
MATETAPPLNSEVSAAAEEEAAKDSIYSCQKCRLRLFATADLKPHGDTDSKPKHFRGKDYHTGRVFSDCSSYFLEETAFFGDVSAVQGKVHCPNPRCGLTLGSFNWSGEACSCGRYVTPAFRITRSRVDEFPATPPELFAPAEEEQAAS